MSCNVNIPCGISVNNLFFRFLHKEPDLKTDLLVTVDIGVTPQVEFFKRQESGEKGEKVCTLSLLPTKQVCSFDTTVIFVTTNRCCQVHEAPSTTTPERTEEFENGDFTLKTHQMFSSALRHFGFESVIHRLFWICV